MPELADRLRTTLISMADEVPESDDPRAGLDRRLAARRRTRRRVPALAAAAAVVVVAGVAVPVVLDRDPAPGGPVSNSPSNPASTGPAAALAWPDSPTPIAWHGKGEAYQELAIARNDNDEVCFLVLRLGKEQAGVDPLCVPMPRWGTGHLVESRSLRDIAAELPMPDGLQQVVADQLVFLTAPEVARVTVRRGDGTEASRGMSKRTAHWGFTVVDFDGPSDGFGYTARDEHGTVLEEALT